MTSHREAPKTSQDPVADNTDVYAFVSPDKTDTATLVANYIPFEEPAGGPNFFQFGDDVLYEIMIDSDGDAVEDSTFQFRFKTEVSNPNTFLYNLGPITSLDDPNWNVRQFYSVTKVVGRRRKGDTTVLASRLSSPPVNIGPRSTPNYADLANAANHDIDGGIQVFAGQRDDPFYVDLGSIFDLGTLRPFQNLHLIPRPAQPGKDNLKGFNVHSIVIQVPKSQLTANGHGVIGVWASASRRKARIFDGDDEDETHGAQAGPFAQVSRLGNPLINEVVIPVGKKDRWNTRHPRQDTQFLPYYQHPELQKLLPILYPGVFPHLATDPLRDDLVAILLTGVPSGVVPGFPGNFTGATQADLLRLNLDVAPSYMDPNVGTDSVKRLGLLGGDIDGFPNGRRIFDNVIDIELRAIAGATLPLVNTSFVPDGAASLLAQRIPEPGNDLPLLSNFPYVGLPSHGYDHSHD